MFIKSFGGTDLVGGLTQDGQKIAKTFKKGTKKQGKYKLNKIVYKKFWSGRSGSRFGPGRPKILSKTFKKGTKKQRCCSPKEDEFPAVISCITSLNILKE